MDKKNTTSQKKALIADWKALLRTFIMPENDAARETLVKYMAFEWAKYGIRANSVAGHHPRQLRIAVFVEVLHDRSSPAAIASSSARATVASSSASRMPISFIRASVS